MLDALAIDIAVNPDANSCARSSVTESCLSLRTLNDEKLESVSVISDARFVYRVFMSAVLPLILLVLEEMLAELEEIPAEFSSIFGAFVAASCAKHGAANCRFININTVLFRIANSWIISNISSNSDICAKLNYCMFFNSLWLICLFCIEVLQHIVNNSTI